MSEELVNLLLRKDERIAKLESQNKILREALENTQSGLLMNVYANLPESPTLQELRSIMKHIVETLNQTK